jgi:hypothetical protein
VLTALGVFLFLYGANYYNNVVGWTGVALFFGGAFTWFFFYFYYELIKWVNRRAQKP